MEFIAECYRALLNIYAHCCSKWLAIATLAGAKIGLLRVVVFVDNWLSSAVSFSMPKVRQTKVKNSDVSMTTRSEQLLCVYTKSEHFIHV